MRLTAMTGLVAALLWANFVVVIQEAQGDEYVEAQINNRSPYVGEQIRYDFLFYDALGTTKPLYQASEFEGFWHVDIGITSQTRQQINGRTYNVTDVSTVLFATHSGMMVIQPARILLPGTPVHEQRTLSANPVEVEVRPLPPGASAAFTGAVGQYSVSASIDRQTVQVGEPITMKYLITGSGNVEQLSAPSVPGGWRGRVDSGSYHFNIQDGLVIGIREFDITVFPVVSGLQELPAVAFDYFDPSDAKYKSISTSPIQIEVTDAANRGDLSSHVIEPSLNLKPIRDISSSDPPVFLMVVLAILPLFAVVVVAYRIRFQSRRRLRAVRSRQVKALYTALTGIPLIPLNDPQGAHRRANDILRAFVADKLGVEVEIVADKGLTQILHLNQIPEGVTQKIAVIQIDIEAGLFSPFSLDDLPGLRDKLMATLREVDDEWKTP